MQNQKENVFHDKFSLLNSQEHSEEIVWSLSDSSDYEEPSNEKFNNLTNRTRLKRKRKKNAPKNLSNLSITVLDTSNKTKELRSGETSPILVSKKSQNRLHLSPILVHTQTNQSTSPVLPLRSVPKSPILTVKVNSPKTGNNENIRKKLFENKYDQNVIKSEVTTDRKDENLISSILDNSKVKAKREISNENLNLVKAKSFFRNHFSSESSTQTSESISEIYTQKNTSDEIDILSCKTRTVSSTSLIKQENLSNQSSENCYINTSKKKTRYKKDGLAYRLNNILRKKNTCLSLWQHEKYLAANSSFVIPKGEYMVFRIQKVVFQYGCYLLNVVDLDEEDSLILINSCYVSEIIKCDTIIKVYEPYKVFQHKDTKLLINVSKFECKEYVA